MQDQLDALTKQINGLGLGLASALKQLQELKTASTTDTQGSLVKKITDLLPTLSSSKLQSVSDYVAFLSADEGAPGDGNEPMTIEDPP